MYNLTVADCKVCIDLWQIIFQLNCLIVDLCFYRNSRDDGADVINVCMVLRLVLWLGTLLSYSILLPGTWLVDLRQSLEHRSVCW